MDDFIPIEWVDTLEFIAPSVTDKIVDDAQPGEDWIATLARLGSVLTMTYQQHELLQMQMDRARAGLPPLDTAAYSPGVNVGLNAETRNMLMWGGGALLCLGLLVVMRGR